MIWVALALAGTLLVVVLANTHMLRILSREQARERNLLLNQVLHLSGRTWERPPAEVRPEAETRILDPDRYLTVPSHEAEEF